MHRLAGLGADREEYPRAIYHPGTQWDSMVGPGLGGPTSPWVHPVLPSASRRTQYGQDTDTASPWPGSAGALGSEAHLALGKNTSPANSRWILDRPPIRQDYGEMSIRELAQDWIRPKGISKQAIRLEP